MKFRQSRQISAAVLVTLVATSAGIVLAQVARPGAVPGVAVSTSQFANTLQDRDKRLASIEQMFARMEDAKTVGDDFGADLVDPLTRYAREMMDDFDTAVGQAQLAARTQGKEGSTALVKAFEDQAKLHEGKLKDLDARAKRILMQVKEGGIQIDKVLLEQATVQDRAEFHRNLSPRAAKELEQKHPDLFKSNPAGPKSSSVPEPARLDRVAGKWPTLDKISDFFIRPAHAAIALTVYTACNNPDGSALTAAQWSKCLQVTQTAINLKAQAQAAYVSCSGNAHGGGNKHWKHLHWKATMLITCGSTLGVKLA